VKDLGQDKHWKTCRSFVNVVPMIIFRYFTREIFKTVLAITGILLVIFLSHLCVRYSGQLADGQIAFSTMIQFLGLQVPVQLPVLFPLGLYLSILLVYGRLYADHEMVVLAASGVSRCRIVCMTLAFSFVIMLIVAGLMLFLKPNLSWYQHQIVVKEIASPLQHVMPGKFTTLGERKWVFYASGRSKRTGHLTGLFVAQRPKDYAKSKTHSGANENKASYLATSDTARPWQIVTAKRAYQKHDTKADADFIVFEQGARYQGLPTGQREFEIVHYNRYGVRLPNAQLGIRQSQRAKYLPTSRLWRSSWQDGLAAAEFQWRIAVPLSVIILALLAIPLSQVKPRRGRYAKLLPAILLYIGYMDMLLVSRAWLKKGLISPAVGMWWIHGIAILLILLLYYFSRLRP